MTLMSIFVVALAPSTNQHISFALQLRVACPPSITPSRANHENDDEEQQFYHEHDHPHGLPHCGTTIDDHLYGISHCGTTHDDHALFSPHCEPCMTPVHGAHFHGYEHGQLANFISLTVPSLPLMFTCLPSCVAFYNLLIVSTRSAWCLRSTYFWYYVHTCCTPPSHS
uniref:Secreted protein n=1 Tax=Echinococcus granulosus TaxID=6210 RepID=A0A068WU20_ECHGR|nr:hypothetical protein EgrG_002024100 [Echinococcus granulosus]